VTESRVPPQAQLGREGSTMPSSGETAQADERFLSTDPLTRLKAYESVLSEHFVRLAGERQQSGWPVFALEHGLGTNEREGLMHDVRACGARGPSRDIPLPWVVYAAEVGYEYSGYEYWQTFESVTPGWQFAWRERIRTRFQAFAKAYHGAEPDGDWARHFNIIAWPITHAILPRDLQRQLAALLYDASMSFRGDTFASAESLGLHLQNRCGSCSSRFRQFAENATLLGQIGLALLLQQSEEDTAPAASGAVLHRGTLGRIVDDLNHERDSRQWLAEARSAARSRVRGLARIPLRRSATDIRRDGRPATETSDGAAELLPSPRFVLRETADGRWQVRLLLPNLAHLLGRFPRARDVLTGAQGRVGGMNGPLLARGRIVSESWPAVTLSTWPTPETPLVSFEGSPPELEAMLHAGFRIGGGDRWLFLIGSDGQARELSTRVLRGGESYLLLQRTDTPNPVGGFGISVVQVVCTGVYALRIDVAADVTDTLVDVLAILGLEVAKTLDVWPAGLPAPDWSGDGRAEWVEGYPIVLGVRADRRITRLVVSVDGIPQPDVSPDQDAPIGDPLFVQLPSLGPGPHRLSMVACTQDDAIPDEPERVGRGGTVGRLQGELEFQIREPRSSLAGQLGALSFAVHPRTPSLEDLWEDRMEIHVAKPGALSVLCRVVLRDPAGRELFGRSFSVPSPCNSDCWRSEFSTIRKGAEDAYDETQVCTLEFDGGALGRARVVAERDFTALRWVVRGKGDSVRLIDSQGCADLAVHTILCASPTLEQFRNVTEALEGIPIDEGGELVIARSRGLEASTVVVPPQRIKDFAALSGPRAQVPTGPRDTATVVGLMRMAALWEQARLAGSSLTEIRRATAVDVLVSGLTGIISGGRWVGAEQVLRDRGSHAAAEVMRGLVASRPDERAVAVVLAERFTAVGASLIADADRLIVNALQPFVRVPDIETVAPFALRLAASPSQARAYADAAARSSTGESDVREAALVEELLARPVILRAARYLVVATRALPSKTATHALPWRSG
jgi:hypothetical protein